MSFTPVSVTSKYANPDGSAASVLVPVILVGLAAHLLRPPLKGV